jgi:hypothetical protein
LEVSFWNRKEARNNREIVRVGCGWKVEQERFINRCKMYDLQMMGIPDATTHISIPNLDLNAKKPTVESVGKELHYPLYHGAIVPEEGGIPLLSTPETGAGIESEVKFTDVLCDRYDEALFAPLKSVGGVLGDLDVGPGVKTGESRNSSLISSQFGSSGRKSRISAPPPIDADQGAFKPSQSSPTLQNMQRLDYNYTKRRLSSAAIAVKEESEARSYLSTNPISIKAMGVRHQRASSFTESFKVSVYCYNG